MRRKGHDFLVNLFDGGCLFYHVSIPTTYRAFSVFDNHTSRLLSMKPITGIGLQGEEFTGPSATLFVQTFPAVVRSRVFMLGRYVT